MRKYVVPRKKRRHLVVEDSVHEAVRLYASQRQLSVVEATYRLLQLAFCQEYALQVTDGEVNQYEIKKPWTLELKSWFRRKRQ